METKSGGVAILLNLFLPGLGQFYAGRIGRGFAFLLVTGGMIGLSLVTGPSWEFATIGGQITLAPRLTLGTLASWAVGLGWWIYSMVDARRLCEDFNQEQRLRWLELLGGASDAGKPPKKPPAYVFGGFCTECGGKVPNAATQCPECGCRIR